MIGNVVDIIVSDRDLERDRIKCRSLIFVATKFPSGDNVRDAKRLLGCVDCGTSLVVRRHVPHPWHVFDAKLFAETVLAWIEGRTLPDEDKELEVIEVKS